MSQASDQAAPLTSGITLMANPSVKSSIKTPAGVAASVGHDS